jgi:hypothetical protein
MVGWNFAERCRVCWAQSRPNVAEFAGLHQEFSLLGAHQDQFQVAGLLESPELILIHIGGHLTPPPPSRWNHRYGFATLFGSIFYPFYDITKLYKLPKEQIHISRLG